MIHLSTAKVCAPAISRKIPITNNNDLNMFAPNSIGTSLDRMIPFGLSEQPETYLKRALSTYDKTQKIEGTVLVILDMTHTVPKMKLGISSKSVFPELVGKIHMKFRRRYITI